MGHTQKPWRVSFKKALYSARGEGAQKLVDAGLPTFFWALSIGGGARSTQVALIPLDESNEANAHLIAAAPELLEAAEEAHEWFRRFTRNSETVYEDESRMLVLLEAAIEKARRE